MSKKVIEKKPKQYVCPICGHVCQTNGAINSHMRKHNPEKKFVCDECGKKFHTNSELRRHQKSHTGVKNFSCPVEGCGRSFTSKQYLEKHIQSHEMNKCFSCTKKGCGASFFIKNELIEHVKKVHPECKGNANCAFCCPSPGCNKCFEFPCQLYRHYSVHNTNSFVCGFEDCLQEFPNEQSFYDHLVSAHGITFDEYNKEMTECSICGIVILKRALNQHMNNCHESKQIKVDETGNLSVLK